MPDRFAFSAMESGPNFVLCRMVVGASEITLQPELGTFATWTEGYCRARALNRALGLSDWDARQIIVDVILGPTSVAGSNLASPVDESCPLVFKN